jgi:hypothetical protein
MSGFAGEQASHNLQVQPPHVTKSSPTYGYQSWQSRHLRPPMDTNHGIVSSQKIIA